MLTSGTPDAPRCGFSRRACETLKAAGIEFGSFDILGDEEVRQTIKVYSDFPTFPQFYVNGELIGGWDILRDMQEAVRRPPLPFHFPFF